MHMRVVTEVPSPGVKQADHADLAPDISWVLCQCFERFRRCAEQHTVDRLLVSARHCMEFRWQGERHHKVRHGQQCLTLLL